MNSWTFGPVTVRRWAYIDSVGIPSASVSMSTEEVAACQPWGSWCTQSLDSGDQNVLVGATVTIIDSGEFRIVVDPVGAADLLLRTGPDAVTHQQRIEALLVAHEVPVESVTHVVMSHLDGIGMVGAVHELTGAWTPFFTNARILIHPSELEFLCTRDPLDDRSPSGLAALNELISGGFVDAIGNLDLAPGVSLEFTGGHAEGHCIVRISDPTNTSSAAMVMIGHLIVHPLNVALGAREGLDNNPPVAQAWRDQLLAESRDSDALLYGPLWPFPGAAKASGSPSTGWALSAAS